jgi:hypothetical protein
MILSRFSSKKARTVLIRLYGRICLPKICANKSSLVGSIRTPTPLTQLEPHYSRSARQTFELVCARRTFLLIYLPLSLCVIWPCDKRVSVASSAGESKLCITWMRWCAAVKIQPVFICVWVGLVTRDLARMTCRHTHSLALLRFIERDAAWRQFQQEIAE